MDKKIALPIWFLGLRNKICETFEQIEKDYAAAQKSATRAGKFKRKKWKRPGGGGGEMSIMYGKVFEKVGVNISTVHGIFDGDFAKKIPGCEIDPSFFASGVSVVAHMRSPLVPAIHFNSRYIATTKEWFGGGMDITPCVEDPQLVAKFHAALKETCDAHDKDYYPNFKKICDEYFYLKHRDEPRGAGGIFYDYLNNGDFAGDYRFMQSIASLFPKIADQIVRDKFLQSWSAKQRAELLKKRGRYVEFNLLYDRGTKFGLETGGNVEAILMSLPPKVSWV